VETRPAPADCDVIFAGGGLASALAAYRLLGMRPDLRVAIVEGGERLGGNHTWSFHESDLTPRQFGWLRPFIAHSWDAQAVRFPAFTRTIASPYHSITSASLHRAVMGRAGGRVWLGAGIAEADAGAIRLHDGRVLRGPCVIDGRGYAPSPALALGFQKFLGQEVRCAAPHGETVPVIMDAAVSQDDGYRFIYTLPLSPDRLLIEDTYYADGAALDAAVLRGKIAAYAAARGWRIAEVVREEHGVLPVVLAGDIDAFWSGAQRPAENVGRPAENVGRSAMRCWGAAAPIGLRAALFHPTTGYSVPDAVRLADLLAGLPELTTGAVFEAVEAHSKRLWRERGFYRMLNRMLFLAAEPKQRYEVLQRFYKLHQWVIARFYAASSTASDKARILIGRPPVSIRRALASLPEASAWQGEQPMGQP
jgi:lycopene beta-cyclase